MAGLFKILLVEDDDALRAVIKRSLLKKSCEVIEAGNGKAAKEVLLLQKFDLVITDIQMPHFTGIDLLEWIKKNQPTPVVLMTGFSQALEAQHASDAGADGFLAKPFRDSDLHDVLAKFIKKDMSLETKPADLDREFCKVPIDEFLSDKETAYDIHLRIAKSKFIKIAHTGGKISAERVTAYKEKGLHFIYVKKEDFAKIVKFNLQVAKVAKKSSQLSAEKKLKFMSGTGGLILENAFVNGVNLESFYVSKDFIETTMNVLTEDEQVFNILEMLSTHADYIYAHSLGVSTFSVMIGRELGWMSTPILFKLALGGLFHDIGKKEIEKNVLEKSRALLTQTERGLIESHTTRGREILESLGAMPSEIALIAYQHHEDILGQGYPNRSEVNEIHPLARVVGLANQFCEYTVKYHPEIVPISGLEAIKKLEMHKAERLDKDAFLALKRLFVKAPTNVLV